MRERERERVDKGVWEDAIKSKENTRATTIFTIKSL